ncbi:MAG: GntR family transcriptional regulator [Desulfobacterales bacterium]|nr:MAG: GntR family transcriptional regulator [Desulfobacterales bacterium]
MQIESIADLAKGHIQVWIIKGEYMPGRQLKEEEIAARLGISRPPVREAFKMLEAEGLVIRKPRRGVFVSEMTQKDVWEAYTLKAALYEMAVELAMDIISEQQINELETVVRKMERCVTAEPVDLLQYQEHHQNFHDQIILISGHDRLKKISASIHNQVSRFSYKSLQNRSHLKSSVRYHRQIIKAIKSGDKVLACRLMKAHVLEALNGLLSMPELQKEAADNEQCTAIAAD